MNFFPPKTPTSAIHHWNPFLSSPPKKHTSLHHERTGGKASYLVGSDLSIFSLQTLLHFGSIVGNFLWDVWYLESAKKK